MGAIFKVQGIPHVLAAVCIVLTVCAPFAGAYAACWFNLAAAAHR
jgi:hypothetical protein